MVTLARAVPSLEDPDNFRIDPKQKPDDYVELTSVELDNCRAVRAHIEYESGLFDMTSRRSFVYYNKELWDGPYLNVQDAASVGV